MHSPAGEHAHRAVGVGHPADGIRMNACGIHNRPGFPALLFSLVVFADGSTDLALTVAFQLPNLGSGPQYGTGSFSGES